MRVYRYARAILACGVTGFSTSIYANNPVWDAWQPVFTPPPYQQYDQSQEYLPARGGQFNAQTVPFKMDKMCTNKTLHNLPDECITKNEQTYLGLQVLQNYLAAKSTQNNGLMSKGVLLHTVQDLLAWHDGRMPSRLQEHFMLRELNTVNQRDAAKYTGYFTPVIQVRAYPSDDYRFPIYRRPPAALMNLSRQDILSNALSGRNLEVAWTNDPVGLYFAQVQGSGVVVFPDGREMLLDYAGNNGKAFQSIATHMKQQGYQLNNYGNDGIREWLNSHPEQRNAVLASNPRYVYFNLTEGKPKTASGTPVITGHTVAVDSTHIPLGAVLLGEVPRIDANGREVGSDWRLLFAQDRGGNIQGAGRLDLYTGVGKQAEEVAHRISGYRKTYWLLSKTGITPQVAGL